MITVADTSVLVAAMVEAHPSHVRSLAWFNRALSQEGAVLVCTHSIAELYSVLTRLPVRPRIGPDTARRLLRENIENSGVRIIDLDAADYHVVLDRMAEGGFSGGVIYDALVVQAALKTRADRIMTLNESDFVRLCPRGLPKVGAP